MTESRIAHRFRAVVGGGDRVPLPGAGNTWGRFEFLAELAAEDLSLARLGEGHVDAVAILADGGRVARAGTGYGVWVSRSGPNGLVARPAAGGWSLTGEKAFCSGSGLVDRAIVSAESPDGYRLFDVATEEVVVSVCPNSWPAVGMADSRSETLQFGGVVADGDALGPPEFYLERPGFWFGACGVAACWYGGALGLARHLLRDVAADGGDLVLLEIGRMAGGIQAMEDALRSAASAIDADPTDGSGTAQVRALALRQIIHDGCQAVLARTAAAGGARPLCHDGEQSRRAADLYVYLSQHHGAGDAVRLGRAVVEGRRWH